MFSKDQQKQHSGSENKKEGNIPPFSYDHRDCLVLHATLLLHTYHTLHYTTTETIHFSHKTRKKTIGTRRSEGIIVGIL